MIITGADNASLAITPDPLMYSLSSDSSVGCVQLVVPDRSLTLAAPSNSGIE
jgi:hypothetical protein